MKHLMMGFAACILMMTSCTQQEITESVSDGQGQLNFSTGIGKQTTRAAELMNSTLKTAAGTEGTGIVLNTYEETTPEGTFKEWFNDKVWYAGGEWQIKSTRFRNTAATKFITYFPKTSRLVEEMDKVETTKTTFETATFAAGGVFPAFTYTVADNTAGKLQEDLIAGITEIGANKTDIVLGMRHILSQVNFGTVGYNGAEISIRNIQVLNLYDKATYTYKDKDDYPIGDWGSTSYLPATRDIGYEYYNHSNSAAPKNPQPAVPVTATRGDVYIFGDGGNAGPGRKTSTLYPIEGIWTNAPETGAIALGNSLMLMPQTLEGAKVTFEYQITDVDGAFVAGGPDLTTWAEGEFSLNFRTGTDPKDYLGKWEQNYRYVYLIDFTDFLDGIALTFTVDVEKYPWENYDGDEGKIEIIVAGQPTQANMNAINPLGKWYIATQTGTSPTPAEWAQVIRHETWDLSAYDFMNIEKNHVFSLNFDQVIFNTSKVPADGTPTTITMTLPDGYVASVVGDADIKITGLPPTYTISEGKKTNKAFITITNNNNHYSTSATLKKAIEEIPAAATGTALALTYKGTENIDLKAMEPTLLTTVGNTITVKFNNVIPTIGTTMNGIWTWNLKNKTATWTRVEWKDLTNAEAAFKDAAANQIIYCSDATEIDLSVEFGEPRDPANTPVIVVFKTAAARTVQNTAAGTWSYNATTLTATWARK